MQKSAWMVTRGDATRYLEKAREDPSADARRDALRRLLKTRHRASDETIEACKVIAMTDRSASVRSVATRLLAESLRADVAETMLGVLAQRNSADTVESRVIVDVLNALYFLERNGCVSDTQRDQIVREAANLVRGHRSRDVRIAAARLLSEYPRLPALSVLIEALNDEDFGVVYQADRSLMHLTGVRHKHDADAWRAWMASVESPFELMGMIDHELASPPSPKWWQRVGRSIKRVFTRDK